VDAGPDIYLCAPPSPTQLNGDISGPYLSFTWSPLTGMTGSNTLTPTVNVTTTTSYILKAKSVDLSNNVITNGDFEGGNYGFTSDYLYNPGNLVPEGYYDVITNPQADHPGFAPCGDHTSGSGNMMVVNGAGIPNENVWCETVPVLPNTQYVFSCWVTSVVAASPALLQFNINGSAIGPIFSAPGQTCVWAQFYNTWNSGANSSATICIVNQNTTLGGNDFALDDIVFSPVCTRSDTVTVHVVSVTAAASPAVVTIPCTGVNITLSGVGSSTGANITYNWDTSDGNIVSGATTLHPVVNAAGTYTLTVSYTIDGNVCTKTATVTVIDTPNPLTASINPPPPLGCGSASVLLMGNSSQPGFSTWQWSTNDGHIVSGANAKNCSVDKVGTYTLLVTNTATGCTATAEVTVTIANNPPAANATASGPITCVQTNSNLSGNGSTTGAGITYAWTTTNGTITSGQNTINAVAGSAGTYILAVTNTANNCTTKDTVDVTANTTLPTVVIQQPEVLDCNTDTVTISATVTPVNAGVSWTASPGGTIVSGQNTLTPRVTTAGTYTIHLLNTTNGCTASGSVTVTADHTPPVVAVHPADTITCQQSHVTLSASGSSTGVQFNYHWTANPGGNIVSGADSLAPVVNAAGLYTLLITNSINACTAMASVPVVADTNVVVAIANAPDTLNCATHLVTLDANGSTTNAFITYNWTTTNGHITSGANTAHPTADLAGTYQLLLTNTANGCSATDLAIVEQDTAAPVSQIVPPGLLTCANPVQTITAQNLSLPGHFTYLWTTAGGHIVSGDSTLTPSVNTPGLYTIQINNLHNGCSATAAVSVQQQAGVPTVVINPPQVLTCTVLQQSLNTNGSSTGPDYAYQWTASAGGHIASGPTTPNPVIDAPGTYGLTVTNTTNGCTTIASTAVTRDTAAPVIHIQSPAILTCLAPNQTLQTQNLSLPGNFTYQWTTSGTGQIASGGASLTPLINTAGQYQILVTNTTNGCTSTESVAVSDNLATPQLQVAIPGTLNCTQPTQTLKAQNTSPAGSFTYSWTTNGGNLQSGATGLNPVVNAAGQYSLLATNNTNGCTASISTSVSIDTTAPVLQVQAPGIVTCAQPTLTIQAQNLSLPGNFTYAWTATNGGHINSGTNTLIPIINSGGDYALLTTNNTNGCTATISTAATQNTVLPTADAGPDNTLSCTINSLTITGSGTGNGPLTYAWTASNNGNIISGANTPTPSINSAGTFTLLVTNTANGCTASDVVQILKDLNAPVANAGTAATLTCTVTQTTLHATASSGAGISYQWSAANGGNLLSGTTGLTPVVNAPGTYQILVTNATNGCTITSTVTVPRDTAAPIVHAGTASALTCTVHSLSLAGSAMAANGGALQYAWTGAGLVSGGTTLTPVVNKPGNYTLSVTNTLNGCTAANSLTVPIDTLAPAVSTTTPPVLTCAVTAVPITGTVTQPTTGYTVIWATANGHIVSGGTTLTPSVNQPGLYTVTIQNQQNGCTTTASATATQNIVHPVAVAGPAGLITCTNPQVSLNGTGSSTGAGISYAWSAASGGHITGGANTLNPAIDAAGTFTLTVTDNGNGCVTTATTTVTSNTQAPAISIVPPQILSCIASTVNLNGTVTQPVTGFTAVWSTNNGHLKSGQNTLAPVVDQPGVYLLTVTNQLNGCTAATSATVTQNIAPPVAIAGPTNELNCNQPDVTLQGSSPTTGPLSWAWATADGHIVNAGNTPNPIVDAPGTYHVTVTSQVNGCTATDAVAITEIPLPAFTPSGVQPNCLAPKGSINFGTVTGGEPPFVYSIDEGQTFHQAAAFSNLAPGHYSLVVQDKYGCTAGGDIVLQTPVYPKVTLPAIEIIELGESVKLEPVLNLPLSSIASFTWTPTDSLSCHTCESPIANPVKNIQYNLTIKDLNGCTADATVRVQIDKNRQVYAPNVFSPNDDGRNDRFTLYGKGVRDIRSMRIYDRWGSELFLKEHLPINVESAGWDGKFKGSDLTPAVFVWVAEVEFLDGEVELLTGDVTIVR
jgi:gliding motility-associated-like protein